jgi:hypothetical protein
MANERLVHEAIGRVAISLCFFVLAVPLLFFTAGNYAWDQDNYHVPAILQIRAHWPFIDLDRDVLSAIAPGYHWFLATLSLVLGTDLTVLRTINLAVSFLVLVVLYRWLRTHLGPIDSAILLSPLATSNFFIKSSAWVVTDNASLLLVATVLIGILRPQRQLRLGLLGIVAAAAVFVRQINAWLVGPLLLRWYRSVPERTTSYSPIWRVIALATISSPLFVLAWLYASWNGLVPPRWQEAAFRISLSGIAYLAVVFLMFSLFVFGVETLVREVRRLDKRLLLVALGIGLIIATVSPTTYSHADGRWGGYFWAVVERVPNIRERSLFFLVLSPLGTLAAAGTWQLLRSRVGPEVANLWLFSIACWSATFLVNRQVFHRYFEPMVLVFVVTAAAVTSPGALTRGQRFRVVVLAVLQAGGTLVTAWAKSS